MANTLQRMLQRLIGYEEDHRVIYDLEIHSPKTEVIRNVTRQQLPRIGETYHLTFAEDYQVVDVKHFGSILKTEGLEEITLVSKKNPLVVLHPKK